MKERSGGNEDGRQAGGRSKRQGQEVGGMRAGQEAGEEWRKNAWASQSKGSEEREWIMTTRA